MKLLKYIYYLLVCVLFMVPSYLYSQVDSLISKRTLSYENYLLIRDTMTVRTWMNMRNYSENLEDVVQIDNHIIDSLISQNVSDNEQWKTKSDSLQKMLSDAGVVIKDQDAHISDSFYQLKFLVFTFGVLIVLLIVFIFLTIVYIIKFRRWKARANDIPEQNDEIAMVEIETLKGDITKLKSELEALKSAYLDERKSKKLIEDELRILLEQLDIPD